MWKYLCSNQKFPQYSGQKRCSGTRCIWHLLAWCCMIYALLNYIRHPFPRTKFAASHGEFVLFCFHFPAKKMPESVLRLLVQHRRRPFFRIDTVLHSAILQFPSNGGFLSNLTVQIGQFELKRAETRRHARLDSCTHETSTCSPTRGSVLVPAAHSGGYAR